MTECNAEVTIRQIEEYWQHLKLIRSVLPYIKPYMAGRRDSPSPTFFKDTTTVLFDKPLTQEKIKDINLAGHFVNQGFVVTLWAHLDYCHIYKNKINPSLSGYHEIDILRLLRNKFAHTSGYYNSNNKDHKKLYERIIKHFKLDRANHSESERLFPIPIDKVLQPLVNGCKAYVNEISNHQNHVADQLPEPLYKLQYQDGSLWLDITLDDGSEYCTPNIRLINKIKREYTSKHPNKKLRVLQYKPTLYQQ